MATIEALQKTEKMSLLRAEDDYFRRSLMKNNALYWLQLIALQ